MVWSFCFSDAGGIEQRLSHGGYGFNRSPWLRLGLSRLKPLLQRAKEAVSDQPLICAMRLSSWCSR